MAPCELTREQREEARWRILRTIYAGRPIALLDTMIWRTLHDLSLPLSLADVQRELDYLESRKLVELKKLDDDTWLAELTWHGVDVVEYTVDCGPGIARPRKR